MRLVISNRQERKKKYMRKEVNKMRKICTLAIAAIIALTAFSLKAAADLPGDVDIHSTQRTVISVHTFYNALGVALSSTNTATTTLTTERTLTLTDTDGNPLTDADGNPIQVTTSSTTTTVSVVESSWRAGSLKTDSVHTTSRTESSDGSWSESEYTDHYAYDGNGNLQGVGGCGTMNSAEVDIAGNVTESSTGEINRVFEVRDGQALLISSETTGIVKDKDGEQIGTFANSVTVEAGDYEYLGGDWVAMKQTQTTYSNRSTETGREEQTVSKITEFSRNQDGVITGMSQTATGQIVTTTGIDGDDPSTTIRNMTNYTANIVFDPQLGWYVQDDHTEWETEVDTAGGGDNSGE